MSWLANLGKLGRRLLPRQAAAQQLVLLRHGAYWNGQKLDCRWIAEENDSFGLRSNQEGVTCLITAIQDLVLKNCLPPQEQEKQARCPTLEIVVDDAWIKAMPTCLPPNLTNALEIAAWYQHQFTALFTPEYGKAVYRPVLFAPATNRFAWTQPRSWLSLFSRQPHRQQLVCALPCSVLMALQTWARREQVEICNITSLWAKLGASVGQSLASHHSKHRPPWGLLSYHGGRLSLGLWRTGKCVAWRSCLISDALHAKEIVLTMCSAHLATTESLAIWQGGEPLPLDLPAQYQVRQIELSAPASHRQCLNFLPLLPHEAQQLSANQSQSSRRLWLGLAFCLTLLACLWVSFPEWGTGETDETDFSTLATARVMTRPRPPANDLATLDPQVDAARNEAEQGSVAPAEEVSVAIWPKILGRIQTGQQDCLLYELEEDSGCATRGTRIAQRFRLVHLSAQRVVLQDTLNGEKQEFKFDEEVTP